MNIGEIIIIALFVINAIVLVPYIKRRMENLATKEDMAAITHEVEQVKLRMNKQLEDHKTGNQLRMAVVERRFQAHQEAYVHWFEVMKACFGDGDKEVISRSQEWWIKNCLYLDAKPRFALRQANHLAKYHIDLLRRNVGDDEIRRNADKIEEAGQTIESAVGLPPIADPVEFFDKVVEVEVEPGTGVRVRYKAEKLP